VTQVGQSVGFVRTGSRGRIRRDHAVVAAPSDESEQPLVDETEERDPLVASVGSSKAKVTKAAPVCAARRQEASVT
jgi:hypothetical protein